MSTHVLAVMPKRTYFSSLNLSFFVYFELAFVTRLRKVHSWNTGRMKNGIPKRWLPYTPMGTVIPGTRFFALKVPLREIALREQPRNMWHTSASLLDTVPNLGLVVDITNTTYYLPEDFLRRQVQYAKILCPGQEIPPPQVVDRFTKTVDKYLKEHMNDDTLIGVHCTHGLNRTGYLICRYMIEKLNWMPENAIYDFNLARGHEMEREEYLADLMRLKTGADSEAIKSSSVPLRDFPEVLRPTPQQLQSIKTEVKIKEARMRRFARPAMGAPHSRGLGAPRGHHGGQPQLGRRGGHVANPGGHPGGHPSGQHPSRNHGGSHAVHQGGYGGYGGPPGGPLRGRGGHGGHGGRGFGGYSAPPPGPIAPTGGYNGGHAAQPRGRGGRIHPRGGHASAPYTRPRGPPPPAHGEGQQGGPGPIRPRRRTKGPIPGV